MPLKGHLKRWKTDLKQHLGLPSQDASTTSLPNDPHGGTSSPSQPGSGTVTPSPDISAASSQANTAWAGLKTFLSLLDASADAFGPLKSAVSGLNKCIEIFESAAKVREDFNGLRERLNRLLEDLNQHADDLTTAKMTASMRNLCNGINKELQLIEKKWNRGGIQRLAEAQNDSDEVLGCYRRIQDCLERLNLNASLDTWRIVNELATEARLKDLSRSLSAVYNSSESETIGRRSCTPGTREDEMNRLRGWAGNPDGGSVYWMNGMAGTGKTTIAHSLCEDLRKSSKLGASFFCSRLLPDCRTVASILPSIAYQLARFSRPFYSALSKVLEANPDMHRQKIQTQFESLIVTPLLEVERTLSDVVVVVDALDECEDENSVGRILEVLTAGAQAAKLPIRFLVSSRPEPIIHLQMKGSALDARLVLHELDGSKVNQDIRTYLEAELKDVPLTSEQLESLVEQCGVLFIFASTAARYIKAGLDLEEHEERLNMILGLTPASASGDDSNIDYLYSSILKTAFLQKGFNESNLDVMKTILHSVICAQEPMSLEALTGFLGLKSTKRVDTLLRPLGSVLRIAETTRLVTTLHASFPDFMLSKHRAGTFHCDPKINHSRLAVACFGMIAKPNPPFNICQLESSYDSDDNVTDLKARMDKNISEELFYACRYWITHLELGDPLEQFHELLYSFLSLRLLLWMEVLNLKMIMGVGAKIIQQAESWSRTHNCSNETTELAHDAWRFVTMFSSHVVSESTPHLYISMLPFWPESSPIAKHYTTRMQGAIEAQGTAMSRRQLALLATWSFDDSVQSARFSPDGSLIVFGASPTVFVIDATTGRTVVDPLEHESTVGATMWEKIKHAFQDKPTVRSVAFSPDGSLIASGSDDTTIRVWSAQHGQSVGDPITGHTHRVNSICFSPDGKHIASGSDDTTVCIWDVQNGQIVVGPLQGHTEWVSSVCFSPDGTLLASGSWDMTIQLWDARSGLAIAGPLRGHTNAVMSICFSQDGTRIASGSADHTMRVWDIQSESTVVGPLQGHTNYVVSISFSPDDSCIVSGSRDHTIRLWDLNRDPISVRVLKGHTGYVTSVAFSSDGSRIVSCSSDSTIRVWDARSQATLTDPLEGHTESVTSVGFSPDGKYIVSGSLDMMIRMWDAQSGQMVGSPLKGHIDWVRSVCFSPDGTHLFSGGNDGTIRAWDVPSGQEVVGPLKGYTDQAFSICLSPDGALIASGFWDGIIRVWNVQDGNPVDIPLEGHRGSVYSVCFSPDSRRVASGSEDLTVRVFDVQSGQPVTGPLEGHTDSVHSVCFSPDGTRLASGSDDTTIRLWDAQSGQAVFDLEGHTGTVFSVCFSPDGTLIVSGSNDSTLRLWDAQSGQAIGAPLFGHTGWVSSVAFSPNGRRIVSGSHDQTIRVWDVSGLLRMAGVAKTLPGSHIVPISPHESWVLCDDGWVVDARMHLLAWVPPDLHVPLLHPHHTLRISTEGYIKLGFNSANLGESWVECYQPPSC